MATYRRKLLDTLAVICLIIVGAVAIIALAAFLFAKKHDQTVRRHNAEWVSETKASLRAGKQSNLHFYSSSHTDEMVNEFAGMPEVTSAVFDMTDLSDEGVEAIARLPNLSELTLYGGRPGVGDRGIRFLAGHQNLTKLKLVNTKVTDDGLDVLAKLPALTDLTLFREKWRDTHLTDDAVEHLKQLQGLKKLSVSGGWMSPKAIEELRKALPNCEVTTELER
jgi:hypothetical protein